MRFIKKNKFIIVLICIVSLILLTAFYSIVSLLFPNLGNPIYGNRIDNIDKVKIDEHRQMNIVNKLKENDNVNNASMDIRGPSINIIIDVKSGVDINIAKNIGVKTLTEFSTDEKDFYDIQIFITQTASEDETIYPIIGYKHRLSPTLVWTGK